VSEATPTPETGVSQHRRRAWHDLALALAFGAVALAERLGALFTSNDRTWSHSVLLEGDAPLWIDWLRAIRAGTPFELGLPIHSPVVPHVLSLLGADPTSSDWTSAKVVWCVVSSMTVPLLYLAVARTLGRAVAIIASLWLAFSFHSIALATSLNGEAIYTFLLVAIVLLGAPGRSRSVPLAILHAAAVGGLHGLATLTRAEHPMLMLMLLAAQTLFPPRPSRIAPRPTLDPPPAARAGSHLPGALRRSLFAALALLASIATCLPWSFAGARAAHRLNTVPLQLPNYAGLSPPWTDDARAYMESLPAFVRMDNAAYLSALASQRRETGIDADRVRRYFNEEFGWTPTPLSTRPTVSSQGPLCFALANHPASGGGFSRAAFDDRFSPDPNLMFALPSHLRLYNDGYAVGLEYIRADPGAWLALLGRKLLRFEAGVTGGMGLTNAPIGRTLTRWPVDLAARPARPSTWTVQPIRTSIAADALWWRLPLLGLAVIGAIRLVPDRRAWPWLLIIASKLVVTAAFYGYVRQSASILPAFAVLIAAGVVWLGESARLPRWVGASLVLLCVLGVLTRDLLEFRSPLIPTIEADADAVRPARVSAEHGAFECYKELRVEYAPPSPNAP
jgi:hypothetical protein